MKRFAMNAVRENRAWCAAFTLVSTGNTLKRAHPTRFGWQPELCSSPATSLLVALPGFAEDEVGGFKSRTPTTQF